VVAAERQGTAVIAATVAAGKPEQTVHLVQAAAVAVAALVELAGLVGTGVVLDCLDKELLVLVGLRLLMELAAVVVLAVLLEAPVVPQELVANMVVVQVLNVGVVDLAVDLALFVSYGPDVNDLFLQLV